MQPFQILVVEDFEPFRRLICSTLRQRAEFQVAEASDGLEAIRKAERLQPDLILLDIGLPNLNGIEVSKCASKLAPAAKILFLSQESSSDVVRGVLSIGAQGYIQKLHVHCDLLPAIDAVLKGKRFVSSGLLEEFPCDGKTQSREPKYLWQQKVMDAFLSSPESLAPIGTAEMAIAARLRDPSQKDVQELLALRCALRSLAALIDEVPQPNVGEKKNSA